LEAVKKKLQKLQKLALLITKPVIDLSKILHVLTLLNFFFSNFVGIQQRYLLFLSILHKQAKDTCMD